MLAMLDSPTLSLIAEIAWMTLAAVVGRFLMKSRLMIWVASFLGAFGAMVANTLIDGQGAFIMLIYTPLIYLAAVAGRDDLFVRGRPPVKILIRRSDSQEKGADKGSRG